MDYPSTPVDPHSMNALQFGSIVASHMAGVPMESLKLVQANVLDIYHDSIQYFKDVEKVREANDVLLSQHTTTKGRFIFRNFKAHRKHICPGLVGNIERYTVQRTKLTITPEKGDVWTVHLEDDVCNEIIENIIKDLESQL